MMESDPEHTLVEHSLTDLKLPATLDRQDGQAQFSTKPEVLQNGSEADGPVENGEEEIKYPSGWKLVSIILSLYLAVLLTVLV